MWKNQHEELIKDVVVWEKRIFDMIKPGVDGTLRTSVIARELMYFSSLGIPTKLLVYPFIYLLGVVTIPILKSLYTSLFSNDTAIAKNNASLPLTS